MCIVQPERGAAGVGPSSFWSAMEPSYSEHQRLNLTESGVLFFDSADALVPHATDGQPNVYEYENGHVYAISDVSGGLNLSSWMPAWTGVTCSLGLQISCCRRIEATISLSTMRAWMAASRLRCHENHAITGIRASRRRAAAGSVRGAGECDVRRQRKSHAGNHGNGDAEKDVGKEDREEKAGEEKAGFASYAG